jgi:hypothetical protein
LPFEPGPDVDVAKQIMAGKLMFSPSMTGYIVETVKQCCVIDPEKRPTVQELLEKGAFKAVVISNFQTFF